MKLLVLLLVFIFSLTLSSCYKKDVYEGELVKKEIPLEVLGTEYTIPDNSITTYFYPEGNVPLIGIDELIKSLDGYMLADTITRIDSSFSNRSTYSWQLGDFALTLTADWALDRISVNDMYFFNCVKSLQGVDVMSYLNRIDAFSAGRNNKTFDLGNYDIDMIYYKEEILVPADILNTLFLAPNIANLIFNGDKYIFTPHYISNDYISKFRESSLNGTNLPKDVREETNKGLYFTMDYFYGLNEVKGFTDGFEAAVKANPLIYSQLNSLDPLENKQAYLGIFMGMLDELHSSCDIESYYLPKGEDKFNLWDNLGPHWTSYYSLEKELTEKYNESFTKNTALKFEGNTAFINLVSFDLGWDDMIYDENHNLKPDAWRYDTYEFMYKVMDEIKKNEEIENIVIDLSRNGGGYLVTMLKALSFLTNKPIMMASDDSLTGFKKMEIYKGDTNKDGLFDDNDGYPNYNWNLLVSGLTFSAGNTFTSICKDMGIAKVLGEKTGGGMCSVMQYVLLDGTVLRLSSNSRMQSFKLNSENKYDFKEIETGVNPDYFIPRDKFYDLAYLNNFINNDYKTSDFS